eukprot:TRINITY_DN12811_c0_g1_i1.p1 TRINITY_DN12811_c0_g1~~TRINITY_DN12811_c0_g1_i1.p1  ORF type:complete len:530 (-),score=73.46 TRINITY_DN12811_c0_g1_i1:96-1523(-)
MRGTNKLFAMKKLRKSKMIERNQVAHIKAERDALANLNDFYKQNPWVVRLYYSFQDALYLYFIMEYVPGGDLMSQLIKMEVFTEEETRFYIAELVLAIGSIHRYGYIHRDIKPDNILMDKNGHIKLSDFGLCTGIRTSTGRLETFRYRYRKRQVPTRSKESGSDSASFSERSGDVEHGSDSPELYPERDSGRRREQRRGSMNPTFPSLVDGGGGLLEPPHRHANTDRFASWRARRRVLAYSEVGTPDYMAPEILDPESNGYGQEADFWAIGVIMFEMLAGFPTFYSSTASGEVSTFEKILNWQETLREAIDEVELSDTALDLIRRFLCDRDDRIGSHGGVREIQEHPFFEGIDWENIRTKTAPIVPHLTSALDTRNFPNISEEESDSSIEEDIASAFPRWGGRRLRQNDIPFIGFTYKNLAAVPSLLSSVPDTASAAGSGSRMTMGASSGSGTRPSYSRQSPSNPSSRRPDNIFY